MVEAYTTTAAMVTMTVPEAFGIAQTLHRAGEGGQSEMLYRRILEADGDNLETLNYLALLRHRQERRSEAAELIERIIALDPLNADAHNNLGTVYDNIGDADRAELMFRRAIELNPQHAPAYNNLGVVLAERRRLEEAVEMYAKAVELAPDSGDFSCNLGNALRRMGCMDAAAGAYSNTVELSPDHFNAWQGLARTLRLAGRLDEAMALFDKLIGMKPADPTFAYLRAACLGETPPGRAPDDYVQRIFDDASDSFDRHLESLDYHAPSLLGEALAATLPPPAADLAILDAGCGTGLCQPHLRPYAKSLVGVDLSFGMLKKAARRGGYEELIQAELTAFLEKSAASYDVVASADTLCYFGELGPVVKAAAGALRDGGYLAFTVEAQAEEPASFILNSTGRYAHGRPYVEESLTAAGLRLRSIASVVLRTEGKEPVNGHVVVAQK